MSNETTATVAAPVPVTTGSKWKKLLVSRAVWTQAVQLIAVIAKGAFGWNIPDPVITKLSWVCNAVFIYLVTEDLATKGPLIKDWLIGSLTEKK